MTVVALESLDVDELRCRLVEETNEALGLGDELAVAVDEGRITDARQLSGRLHQVRNRMRALRSYIRVEEGSR